MREYEAHDRVKNKYTEKDNADQSDKDMQTRYKRIENNR